jgi:hypothetical protein
MFVGLRPTKLQINEPAGPRGAGTERRGASLPFPSPLQVSAPHPDRDPRQNADEA